MPVIARVMPVTGRVMPVTGQAMPPPEAWPGGMAGRSGADLLAHCLVMDGHAETLIDLDAIKGNVTALREHVGAAAVMAVVKSDAYGHGMVPAARAALAGGASWMG
jgi:alanine racemase